MFLSVCTFITLRVCVCLSLSVCVCVSLCMCMSLSVNKDAVYLDYRAGSNGDLYKAPNDFLGKRVDEVLPADLARLSIRYIKRALKSRNVELFEYQLEIEGEWHDYECHMNAIDDSSVIAIVRDITGRRLEAEKLPTLVESAPDSQERKRADEVLRTTKEYLDTVILKMPAGLAILEGAEFKYFRINQELADINGLSMEEHLGRPIAEVLPQAAKDIVPVLQKVLDTGESTPRREFSTRLPKDPDEIRHFIDCLFPIKGPDGKVKAVGVVVLDIGERKRAEEALEQSEQRFKLAVQGSNDGMWDWPDITKEEEWWSPQWYKLLGYEDGELEANFSNFNAFLHPDDLEKVKENVRAHFEERVPFDMEYRLKMKSGEYRWFRGRGQALWDDQGKPTRMSGSIQDITERKRVEEALRQANEELEARVEERTEELQKALQDSEIAHQALLKSEKIAQTQFTEIDQLYKTAPVGLCLLDRDLRYLRINQQLADINGKPISDHIDKTIYEVIPDIAKIVADTYLKVIDSGEPIINSEVKGFLPAQPELPRNWLVSYYPLMSKEGQVEGVSTVVIDITERKAAAERIVTSQKMLSEAQRIAGLGSFEWVIAKNQLFWSPELCRIYGIKSQEFEGTAEDFFNRVHPDDLEKVKSTVERALRDKSSFSLEERIKRPDGTVRILDSLGEVILDDDGAPVKVIGVCQDITERKQAEVALHESEKTLRQLVETTKALPWEANAQTWRFTYVGPRAVELLGYPSEKWYEKDFWAEHIHPEDREWTIDFCMKSSASLKDYELEYRMLAADGRIVWFHDLVNVVPENGKPRVLRGFMIDITDRKLAETERQKSYNEIKGLKEHLQAEATYLREEIKSEHGFHEIVGNSDALLYVLNRVETIAPTDTAVLILGETGTGKELFARALHDKSRRKDSAFVKVNCATLPKNLIESELFGHERGAFTGAVALRRGRFELAEGGTIFLDEIGELPLELQPKLLRVLQEGEFERLGGEKTQKTDVRVIAATNRDLNLEVRERRFRQDLFYRLDVFPITVPPLRERLDDLVVLAEHFISKFSKKLGKHVDRISQATLAALKNYYWPGNVRELENIIERAMVVSLGSELKLVDDLQSPMEQPVVSYTEQTLAEVERKHITQTLEKVNWRIEGDAGAAKILGMHPSTLRNRLLKLNIRRSSAAS